MRANEPMHLAGPIGQSVRRKEDHRFLTGTGRCTDDVNPANHTHA